MSWTTADIPPQDDRVAVVTGATSGLGLETAKALVAAGAHVVMAARDQRRIEAARNEILAARPRGSLETVPLDLASLGSVAAAAEAIRARHDRIDVLVNNAGLMGIPERRTEEGFEMQFGVNHLGHWALTAQLIPALLRSRSSRVVTVTSTGHHFGRPVEPGNVHLDGSYDPWMAYCRSKLANYHFAIGLERVFRRAGARAVSLLAHPGLSATDLQARSVRETGGGRSQRLSQVLAMRTGMAPAQAALSQLRAATDPHAPGGAFYGPLFVNNGPPVRKPILRRIGLDRAIATLWAVSERETGIRLDVSAARSARR